MAKLNLNFACLAWTLFLAQMAFTQTPPAVVSGNTLVCEGATTTLTAAVVPADPSVTYEWYSALVGGSLLHTGNPYTTPPIVANTTVYCLARSSGGFPALTRTPVAIIKNINLDVPTATVSPANLCPGETVTMTASSINGSTIFKWYDDPVGGALLHKGQVYSISINATTIFYLETEDANGCESARVPITVLVLPNLDVPTATVNPTPVCSGSTVTMTATSVNGSSVFHWFDAPVNGNLLFTGNPYATTVAANTTFYLQSEDGNGCQSSRTPVPVVVTENLDIPIATATPGTVCPGETFTLNGTSINGSTDFYWYDAPTNGTLLATGAAYSTTTNATTIYYLETGDGNGCLSNRTPVTVIVTPNLDVPVATATPATICPGATTTLTATSINGSTIFHWYDAATGGNLLSTGDTYSPAVNTTTTFYVESENANGCKSPRTAVVVTVLPNLDIPIGTATPPTVCPGESVSLTATSTNGSTTFRWYDAATGGNLLGTGTPFVTTVNANTTFYLESEDGTGCASTRTPVVVAVTPNLDVPVATATPATVCPGESVSLSGVSANGSTIFKWYDAATGGNLLSSDNPYVTSTNATTIYYLATESAGGCESVRTPVTVTVLPNLDVPVGTATPATVCPGESVSLTATSTNGSSIFRWYDAPTGGSLLGTGSPFVTTVNNTTTFYLESEDGGGCLSARTPVVVTVVPNLDVPVATATPATVCPGESTTLTATSINGSTVFKWYDALTGGNLLATGDTYSPTVNATTTFYVQSENANGCPSARTAVIVTVLPNLDVPVGTATPPTVCPGENVDLTATSINGSTTFRWYDAATGGNLLGTGTPYSTTVNTTTTFYVESEDGGGCLSARTPVVVTVVPNPDVPVATATPATLCPGESTTLSATSINGSTVFKWYDALTGGNLLATGATYSPTVNATTTFYVQSENASGCASLRTAVVVTVLPNLDVPVGTATPPTVCPGENVDLTATSTNGSTIFNWYDAPTGGILLGTGSPFTTTVNTTTTFYLESESAGGCLSARTPVVVTVVPNLDVPVATATPATVCPGETVTLNGTSINGSTIFNWYDAATGGTLLATGATYTPTVNATTIFYLESENANGCLSARTPVTVTVLPNLDVPVGTATPPTVCPGETVDLTATSVNGSTIFNWYDAATGGNLLGTGSPFSTTVNSTTTFYLESESAGGCLSARTPVVVTVLPNLDVPTATSNPLTICPDESVELTATSTNGSTIFHWYDALTGGNLLFTGNPYNTSVSTTTIIYLASESGDGCESLRSPVTITVVPNADVPVATATPATVCPVETVTLNGTSINGSTVFKWFDALTGGNLLHTGATYATSVSTTTTFYLQTEDGSGCASVRTPVVVTVLPNADVPVATATPATVCPNETVTLTGTSINGSTIFRWYDAITGGNLLHNGDTYVTSVTATTTFYLETEDGGGCLSLRTPVVVTVLPNLDVPVATATPPTVCPGETVTLNGTSINGSTVFNWYDDLLAGTLLASGATYSPTVNTTTTFYLGTEDGNGCQSVRTPVIVTVLPNLDVPVATADPITVCPNENVDLEATSINGSTIFNWYDAATGGNFLHTGATYSTTVAATTIFYVESESADGCVSVRTPVAATVLPNLDVPVGTANPATICPNEPVTLSGTSVNGSTIFKWYDDPLAGNLLHTGVNYSTTATTTTIVYLATESADGCESLRTPVTIVVSPNLDVPVATATPPTVCPGETVTLNGSSTNGSSIFRWYDALTGGNLLHNGASYVTTVDSTTVFYLETENADGCVSVRTPVTVIVLPNLDVPVATATPAAVCPGETVLLSGTSINGSTTFRWYDALTGGNLLFTGANYSTTVSATTIFYLETENADGCVSVRTPVTVVVTPNLDIPVATATPAAVCPNEPVSLEATSINGSTIFNWYDAPAGGTLLASGSTYNTSVTATTVFYVESENADGCLSARTPVTVVVVPNIDVPVGTANPTIVCPGESVTFTGMSITGSTIYHWYDSILDGNLLSSDSSFTTNVNETTTYFLETENGSGCRSVRIPVLVTVLPNLDVPVGTPNPLAACPDDTITLTATSINGSTTFNWYDALMGGNLVYSGQTVVETFDTTTVLYLQSEDANGCVSVRTPVAVTILPNLDVPIGTANPMTACPGDVVTLSGTSINGSTVFNWYDSIVDGNYLASGNTYAPSIAQTTVFYLETENANGCRSVRTPVTVLVVPNLDVPVGTANPPVVCPGDNVILNGSSINGSNIFNWYDTIVAGTPIMSGSSPNTTISQTTIFYLETVNAEGCPSLRTPVSVVAMPNIDLPVGIATPAVICPDETVDFTATSINGSTIFHWYDAALGGNHLYTGTPYQANVQTTSVLYVETENAAGCRSPRTPVVITVTPNIDIPTATATPPQVCSGESTQLSATSLVGAPGFNWYDAQTGGNLLHSGSTYNPVVNATTTYYLESQNVNGCSSARSQVTVQAFDNTDIPAVSATPSALCEAGPVVLTGASTNGSGNFNWYDAPTNGNLLHSGPNYPINATGSTDYYLESVDGLGCKSSRTLHTVAVTPNTDVPVATASQSIVCVDEIVVLTGTSPQGLNLFRWYDAPTAGTLLFNGPLYNDSVAATTTYYLETENANGCKSTRVPVTVTASENTDVPTAIANPSTVCEGNSSLITATSPDGWTVFNWYDASVGGNFLVSASTLNPVVNSSSTYYIETENALGCPSQRVPVTVNATAAPNVYLVSIDTAVCAGETVFLEAGSDTANVTFDWYSTLTGGTVMYNGNAMNSSALSVGLNLFVQAEDAHGCISSREMLSIQVNPNLSIDQVVLDCSNPSEDQVLIEWDDVANITAYEISTDGGATWEQIGTDNFYLFDGLESEAAISIVVRGINESGQPCAELVGLESETMECAAQKYGDEIVIPYNTFSPNGDNVNEFWHIGSDVIDYEDNEVAIYNRLGEEVFRITGYDNQDKVFKGTDLADGSYYYVVNIPSIEFTQTGYVILTR